MIKDSQRCDGYVTVIVPKHGINGPDYGGEEVRVFESVLPPDEVLDECGR